MYVRSGLLLYLQVINVIGIWASWRAVSNKRIATSKKFIQEIDSSAIAIDNHSSDHADHDISNVNNSNVIQNIRNKLLRKCNIDSQMLIAILNAIASIVATSCVLAWSSSQHKGTKPPSRYTPTPTVISVIDGCIQKDYKYNSHNSKFVMTKSVTTDCMISTIGIGMGILIIFVIAFGFFIPKCIKSRNCTCCNSDSRCSTSCKNNFCECHGCCWNLIDYHMRGTIIVKFIYFMLKPLLIYVTQKTSNGNGESANIYTTITNVFQLLYQVLMFCTVSALAYMTFNKNIF